MVVELLIFDWSGTISDDRKPVYEANMRILKAHGKQVIPFNEWLSISTSNVTELLSKQGITWNVPGLSGLYETYYNEEIEKGNTPKIYPEVSHVLKHFKDKRRDLAVLSSHPERFLLEESNKYGINNLFDIINGSSTNKSIGLETIYKILDFRANETAYIGDTIYDIRSAKKIGLVSIAVCGGYHSRDMLERENPDHLIKNLSDLKDII